MTKKPSRLQRVWHRAAPGQKCSVPGCDREAVWTVALVDYYPAADEWFYEQDFTCPFLCAEHRRENEAGRQGNRRPRSRTVYPYTNRHRAQGWSEYLPIKAAARRGRRKEATPLVQAR